MRIWLASFLVFAFCLAGLGGKAIGQTIKSHKIVTPQTETQPSFFKNWPYFSYEMEDMVYFLREKEPLDWQEAKAKFHSGEFDFLEGNVFNKGFTESIWWFAFRLDNPGDKSVEIVVCPYPPFAKEIDFFAIRQDGILEKKSIQELK